MAENEQITQTWLIGTEGMKQMLEQNGISTQSEQPEYGF